MSFGGKVQNMEPNLNGGCYSESVRTTLMKGNAGMILKFMERLAHQLKKTIVLVLSKIVSSVGLRNVQTVQKVLCTVNVRHCHKRIVHIKADQIVPL